MLRTSTHDRFYSKFEPDPNTGCFLWTGAIDSGGYGSFRLNGRVEKAHRASWILHTGNIENNMHVLHSCDNRCCVNIDHLSIGTNADNCFDRAKRNRGSKSKSGMPYGVTLKPGLNKNPYQSRAWDGSKTVSLGHFSTAEEAGIAASEFKDKVIRSRIAYH